MSNAAATEPEIDLDAVRANARAFAESRAALGDEKWLRELEAYFAEQDEDARYTAVTEIVHWERPPYEFLAGLTQDARPIVRGMACYALRSQDYREDAPERGALLYPQAVPVLIEMLNDPDAEVRSCAVSAVANHSLPVCVSALLKMPFDSSEKVRLALAQAFGSFWEDYWKKFGEENKPAVQAALLQLMDDEDDETRNWATFGIHLTGHDTPEIRAHLWQALDDSYYIVRGEAASALSIFGDRSFIPRLAQLLREDKSCSTLYFEAAEAFNDPVLLPAVLEAAAYYRGTLEEGETMPSEIAATIEKLQETATSASAPQSVVN